MLLAVEYCPICQSPKQMNITIDIRVDAGSEEITNKIITKNFQCSSCYNTVRREYLEVDEDFENKERKGEKLIEEIIQGDI